MLLSTRSRQLRHCQERGPPSCPSNGANDLAEVRRAHQRGLRWGPASGPAKSFFGAQPVSEQEIRGHPEAGLRKTEEYKVHRIVWCSGIVCKPRTPIAESTGRSIPTARVPLMVEARFFAVANACQGPTAEGGNAGNRSSATLRWANEV